MGLFVLDHLPATEAASTIPTTQRRRFEVLTTEQANSQQSNASTAAPPSPSASNRTIADFSIPDPAGDESAIDKVIDDLVEKGRP